MPRPVFSPALFNARVETQILAFFDHMNNLYGRRGWQPDPPTHEGMIWRNADFNIAITDRYRDGAYKRIRFTIRNLPGYARKPSSLTSERDLRWEHTFIFDLPREYPQNIGSIRPAAETPLYHPRLSVSGRGYACYSVRGELDRILEDLPFFILLKPDRVEPPSQFKSDHGLNSAAMAWYEQDVENIVTTLDRLWDEKHAVPIIREPSRGRVRILDSAPTRPTRRPKVQILDDE